MPQMPPQQQKEVSTLTEGEIFCFPLHPCIYTYYPNFNASVSPYRSKERFLHRKKRRFLSTPLSPTLYPLWVHSCTVIIKREVSTPEKISRSSLHLSLHG